MPQAAAAYAAYGFPVFPCKPTSDKAAGSKAPFLPGESAPGAHDGGHWLASTEANTVAGWWRRWPTALIGFPTGRRTGTVVIDLDTKERSAAVMLNALRAYCGGGLSAFDPQSHVLLHPAIAVTQSGGLHLYFAWDEARPVKNRAGLFRVPIKEGTASPDLDHIDVRGEGGYVIAPPSVMDNGRAYVWKVRPAKGDNGRWLLPPLPARLWRVLSPPPAAAPRPVAAYRPGQRSAYVEAKISGVLRTLREAREGERNAVIFWAACRMGEFVRGGVMGEAEAEQLIFSHFPAGVNPTEAKAVKTVKNGLSNTDTPAFNPHEASVP